MVHCSKLLEIYKQSRDDCIIVIRWFANTLLWIETIYFDFANIIVARASMSLLGQWLGVFMLINRLLWFIVVNCFDAYKKLRDDCKIVIRWFEITLNWTKTIYFDLANIFANRTSINLFWLIVRGKWGSHHRNSGLIVVNYLIPINLDMEIVWWMWDIYEYPTLGLNNIFWSYQHFYN